MAGTYGYGEELSGSINAGNFLNSCKVYWLASQEGLCSMEYGTHCTGGWVGPRAGLYMCRKSRPHRDSIPGPSSP